MVTLAEFKEYCFNMRTSGGGCGNCEYRKTICETDPCDWVLDKDGKSVSFYKVGDLMKRGMI